jgi:hypothetical protein
VVVGLIVNMLKKMKWTTIDLVIALPRYNDSNFKFMPSNTKHILHLHMDGRNLIPSYPHLNIMNQIFVFKHKLHFTHAYGWKESIGSYPHINTIVQIHAFKPKAHFTLH